MEAFLTSVWEKKLWIVATTIFIFCLGATPEVYLNIKNLYDKQLAFSMELADSGPESKRQLRLLDLYKESMVTIEPMLSLYKDEFENKRTLDPAKIKLGIELANTVSNVQRIKIAEASEIRLSCEACRDLQGRLVSGMGYNLELTAAFLKVFQSKKGAQDLLNTTFAVSMHKNLSIALTVIPALTNESSKKVIEFEKGIADLKLLDLYIWQFIIYIGYMLIFSFAALLASIRFYFRSRQLEKAQLLP